MAIPDPRQQERTELAGHLLRGEQVLQAARMVGDHEDLVSWRRNRDAWHADTRRALAALEGNAASEFHRVTQPTGDDGWAGHDAEVHAVEAGLNVITRLHETLRPPA
jgi:hypothetical protein